jgi:hypothetical protein
VLSMKGSGDRDGVKGRRQGRVREGGFSCGEEAGEGGQRGNGGP